MKNLFILISIILTLSLNAQNIVMQGGREGITKRDDQFSGFLVSFSYNQISSVPITTKEHGDFSTLVIDGTFPNGALGAPQLPVFKQMISIPVGATPRVVVKKSASYEYHLDEYGLQKLFPVQPVVRKKQDPNKISFEYDEKAYAINDYKNTPVAEVVVMGTMRGVALGMLIVNPIQYNPVANTIRAYNNIEIEVVFENGDFKKTKELYMNSFSPYFINTYKHIFNNGVHRDIFDDHPDLYKTPVRMLVVADRMFEGALQPWIEWKTKKGFYMDVNYTDEIGTTAAGIKTFIHNKYNQGLSNGATPTFLVIVGDVEQVPESQAGTLTEKPTDFYYAETTDDLFPEIYYSRMSAQNVQQLQNIIDKTLYYEQYQFEDPSYLDNVFLLGGWDANNSLNWIVPQMNYASNYYYNAAHGYNQVTKITGAPYTNCYDALANSGFANYSCHCDELNWGTVPGNYLSISDVNNFTNFNKYFVAMANCCLSADFGTSECIGEAMIRAQQKAAVAYIGSSYFSAWAEDLYFTVGAYQGPYNPSTPTLTNTTLGSYDLAFHDGDFNCISSHVFGGNLAVTHAHTNSECFVNFSDPRYCWEEYNVLGDGSIMPYNTQGVENMVWHLPALFLGSSTFEIKAVSGSYVAISKDGELLGVALADETGIANVTLTPPVTETGNIDIVVTRNQYIPYITQIPVTTLVGPYMAFNSYIVENEEKLTYISQNTKVSLAFTNVGVAPTAGALSFAFSCDDPQITIHNAVAQYENVVNIEEAISINLYVTIAHDIVNNKTFPVKLTITDNDNTWESIIPLKAYAPVFFLEKVLVDGVEDGNLVAESITAVTVVLKNKGGEMLTM